MAVDPRAIYQYLTQRRGLSHIHALGMLANMQGESGFNPHVTGDNGASYGLFQFQGSRRRNLEAMSGTATPTWQQQIDYALSEPEGRAYVSKQFRDPVSATRDFVYNFERPANKARDALKRSAFLTDLAQHVAGGAPQGEGFDEGLYSRMTAGSRGFVPGQFDEGLYEKIFKTEARPSGFDPALYSKIFGAAPDEDKTEAEELLAAPAKAGAPAPPPIVNDVPSVTAQAPVPPVEAPVAAPAPELVAGALGPSHKVSPETIETVRNVADVARNVGSYIGEHVGAGAKAAGYGLGDAWRQLQHLAVNTNVDPTDEVRMKRIAETEARLQAEEAVAEPKRQALREEYPLSSMVGEVAPYAAASFTPTPLDDIAALGGIGASKLLARPTELAMKRLGRAAVLMGAPGVRRQAFQGALSGGLPAGVGGHAPWYAPWARLPNTLATRAGDFVGSLAHKYAPTGGKMAIGGTQGAVRGAITGAPIGMTQYEPGKSLPEQALEGATTGATVGGLVGAATGPFRIKLPAKTGPGDKVLDGEKPYALVATKNGKLKGFWRDPETGEEFLEQSKAFRNVERAVKVAREQGKKSIVYVDAHKVSYFVDVADIPAGAKITPELLAKVGSKAGRMRGIPDSPDIKPLIAKQRGWTHDARNKKFYVIDEADMSEMPIQHYPRSGRVHPVTRAAAGAGIAGGLLSIAPEEVQDTVGELVKPARDLGRLYFEDLLR